MAVSSTIGTVVPQLTSWGVSPNADLLYRALSRSGPASARLLGRQLGMPVRRAVSGLEELAAIGAIQAARAQSSSSVRWRAAPAVKVLEELRRRAEANRVAATVRNGAPVNVPEIAVLGEGIRHIPTRQGARERLAKLVSIAGREHLAMNPEPVFDAPSAQAGVAMDRTLLNRGVRMSVLGVHPPEVDPLVAYGRMPDEPSPHYRQAGSVPMKLIVIDRKVALFPVSPADYGSGYIEVAQPPVVEALVSLFLGHWDRAQADCRRVSHIVLSEREHQLVLLLAAGHTDASAATKLRVSPRTVSSMLRQLMDRLGVENRFQLGLALGAFAGVNPTSRDSDEEEES